MKSNIYTMKGKKFRYNFDACIVEYIQKADEETLAAEAEWKQKHGSGLYGIGDDGYIILDTIGLSSENWNDREARDGYLSGWCDDLDGELERMSADFVRYELPYLV